MNTKGIKFLAVLAVLAMAFAAFAIIAPAEDSDADTTPANVATLAELKTELAKTAFNVKLTADITDGSATTAATIIKINGTGTIDLNGHNIAFKNNRVFHIESGTVTITGQGTVSADKDTLTTWSDASSVIRVGNDGTVSTTSAVVIGEKVTVSSNHSYGITAFGKDTSQTVTVNGTVAVTGSACAISGNGLYKGAVITIGQKATVSATQDNAIYFPCEGTLTINGTVNGGVEVKAGNTDVSVASTAKISALNVAKDHTPNNNGTSTKGYAIAVVENSGYAGEAVVTINSGTIEGDVILTADSAVSGNKAAKIEIKGGTFNGNISIEKCGNEIPAGIIDVPTSGTFTIAEGKKLLIEASKVTVEGTLTNNGTIVNMGAIENSGTVNNNGVINTAADKVLKNTGTVVNKGTLGIEYAPAFTLTNAVSTQNGGKLVAYSSTNGTFAGVAEVFEAGASSSFEYKSISGGMDIATKTGTTTISGNIYSGWKLTVAAETSAVVPVDGEMTVAGEVDNKGTFTVNGAVYCRAGSTITNTGTITNMGILGMEYTANLNLTKEITVKDGGMLVAFAGTDGKFTDAKEVFKASTGSTFTYDATTTKILEGTAIISGTIYGYMTLDLAANTTVNVPVQGTLTINSGATFTGVESSKIYIEDGGFYVCNAVTTAFKGAIDYAGKEAEIEDAGSNSAIKNIVQDSDISSAIITVTSASSDAAAVSVGTKQVSLNLNENVAISKLDFEVAEGGSISINATSTNASYSGKITTTDGTSKQTIELKNVKGSFTVTKGSVIIDGKAYSGEITIEAGTEVKMSGSIDDGDFVIKMSGTGNAKVIVENDDDKTFEIKSGHNLVIDSDKITLQIDGKVFGEGKIQTNSNIVINKGGELSVAEVLDKLTTATESKKVIITAHPGSAVKTTKVTLANSKSEFVVYSGADINSIDAESKIEKIVGKDGNGGEWTVNAAGTILTLNKYNGEFSFNAFASKLQSISITGDNKITYALPTGFTADSIFGSANSMTAIATDNTASLIIEIDYSKMAYDEIDDSNVIISAGDSFTLNGVSVEIKAFGSSSDWIDTTKIKLTAIAMKEGGAKNDFTLYNATLEIDAFSAYSAKDVLGIDVNNATGSVSIGNSTLLIKSAGSGMDATNKMTIDSSSVVVAASETAIKGKDIDVKNSFVETTGDLVIDGSKLAMSNKAEVGVVGLFKAKTFTITQDSKLSVMNLEIDGKYVDAENQYQSVITKGSLFVLGNALILGELVNNDVISNAGNMAVFGKLTNNATLDNSGKLLVFAKINDAVGGTNNEFTIDDVDNASAAGKVKVKTITLSAEAADISMNADGSISVKATIVFVDKDGTPISSASLVDGTDVFEGILTLSDLADLEEKYYTLELTNGTATVKVTYKKLTEGAADTIGKSYSVDVAGKITKADPVTDYDLEANAEGKKVVDEIKTLAKTSGVDFITGSDSAIKNEGEVVLYASASATPELKGTYNGTLASYLASNKITAKFNGNLYATGTVNVNGTFVGNIVTKGAVSVSSLKTITGDILTEGAVTVSGTVKGNIVTNDSVTINSSGTTEGNVVITTGTTAKTLTVSGKLVGNLIFNSKYLATSTAKAGEETIVTHVMGIDADMKQATADPDQTFVINLTAAKNATSTTAGEAGVLTLGATPGTPVATKAVKLTLTEGEFYVPASLTLSPRFYVTIEKDTTIEVAKTATFNVEAAALKVSNGATANFETGSGVAVNYGKVSFIMSFETADGYKIYSNVAYALSNCDEGQTLTVGKNTEITENVSVKAGVNIIVDDVKLNFQSFELKMAEGAKITLVGTGNLSFAKTGDNGMPADKDWEFYTVNGTVIYDDNVVELNGVRFIGASAIAGVAATSTADSKISTNLQYNEGTVTIKAGNGTGNITLSNDAYALAKDAEPTLVLATFIIGADAVFDTTTIKDKFAEVTYKKDTVTETVVVDKIKLYPTIVGVEGILNLSGSTSAQGTYAGTGVINIAAGKDFTLAASDAKPKYTDAPFDTSEKTVPGNLAVKIVDTTDDQNGYVLNLVAPTPGKYLAIKATTQKLGSETVNVMKLSGDIGSGIVTATTEAFIDKLTINEDASLVAKVTYVVGEESKAIGCLLTEQIYKQEEGVTGFAPLDYQVVFEEEGYYGYAYFTAIDFDEVSDIVIDGKEDAYTLTELVPGATKVDLTGKDVNITIAEGKTLTVNVPLIIGTPITVLGDGTDSSISGKIIIKNSDGANYRYLVAYSDVDLTNAEIYQDGGKIEAVYSALIIDDVLYATIFANEGTYDGANYGNGVGLAYADKSLVPAIEGYIFTKWANLNEDDKAAVGETNAYADFKALSVYVTVKFVTGIAYYCNGVEFAVYDTPVKVEFDSVFTAKISDTSKYQGTPLVNGKNSLIITEDTVIVGSGVEPIPVPPEPEPEPVVGDSGLSLTDILLIVLVVLIAIMVVILVLRLNRS